MSKQDIPLIGPLLNMLIGTRNERFVKRYNQRVNAINAMESQIRKLTDAELRGKVLEFRSRLDKGTKADDLMVEALACAREAMDRGVGIRNIFNPHHNFDPAALPAEARALYDETKAAIDACPPAPPVGEWSGWAEEIPGWMQVDIPNALYEAVRVLYPESRPPFRARPFDVQLIGAMVLTQGKISEMRTGEGKTIVGPLATYLACIERMKVHVVTVNDYLVQRDRDWTAPFFRALGLTVGAIHPQHMQDEDQKRVMYRCDVVYGTTAEFGFDYLRDNMKRSAESQVQKRRQFAIVDEVDSILIDEARTPLIISGPAHDDQPRYDLADRLARHLVQKHKPWADADEHVQKCLMRIKGYEGDIRQAREKSKIPELHAAMNAAKAELPGLEADRNQHVKYYDVEPERKQCHLTHDGVTEAQRVAGIGSFYVDQNMDVPHLLEQALRAHVVYQLDRDYIVAPSQDQMTGKQVPSVVIVDVFTGRPMVGRQWSDGLHQAVEAKESVPIKQETQTVATITIQNFFKMYRRLAGMTGTADTEAQEFHDIYKLDVVSIPTNKPVIRRDFDDLVFLNAKDKWSAICDEIKNFHDAGRPILVGTTSVEKSESLSRMLTSRHGVQHEVLNAKQHEREAHIVENAGQIGSVMIATNMAGRGTDIKLGQISRAALLEHWLKRGICPRTITVDSSEDELREGVYRKLAPQYLDVKKRQVEDIPFAELELMLLRQWATTYTWVEAKDIERMSAEDLRAALDKTGRFLLHRIHWFNTIEEMGGLHVIGTERHEARRIDNQLRGRSGRQGDRGSSRFFVSLEDDLMKMFAGETTMKVLARLGMKEGDAIEHPMLSKSVERAQRKVEERNFQIRKNVLEYDEVMEFQRQRFYGLRQRVLEGRDVKGLIFEYIRDAIDDAIGLYLDPEYPAQCAAEYARQKLECLIAVDRLKGRDLDEMLDVIRVDAKQEASATINVTLGEYMPTEGSDVAVDFDVAGLIGWAKSRFGVELNPADLSHGSPEERKAVEMKLRDAAERRIDETDLSGIAEYLSLNYGQAQLSEWARIKYLIEVSVDEINKAKDLSNDGVAELLLARAAKQYTKREIEYPIDFAMDLTMMLMRQSPKDASEQLVDWANRRFNLGWTLQSLQQSTPTKARQELMAASERFVAENRLGNAINEALACKTDADLESYLRDKLGVVMPENMRYLEGEDRENAIRSRVESVLRAELLHFERTILLDVLDQLWRDHLYAMDQLRDAIGYRAFSQQDPRIEYKREGSRIFNGMLELVRDRVTDYIFKARLSPVPQQQAQRPPMQQAPAPSPAPHAAPAISGPSMGGGITGPGMEPQGGML
ncbi:MAG: preprotein translocase subunit SecA [Phycisphaerales bacterium]|nr:preprotein translocase subunit SecA [Phycisphaerales bacterium]